MWKRVSSKIVHQNPWYYIRQDAVVKPNGALGEYFVVVSHPSVIIVACDRKNCVCIIRQHRYPTNQISLEVPVGGSDGQPPLIAARRELQEETGFIAKKWQRIGQLQTAGGFLSEIMHVYLATELQQTKKHNKTEEGIQSVRMIPLHQTLRMVKLGKITSSQTASALLLAALELG